MPSLKERLQEHLDRVIVACWDSDHVKKLDDNTFCLSLPVIPLLAKVSVQPSVDISVWYRDDQLTVNSVRWTMKVIYSILHCPCLMPYEKTCVKQLSL